METALWIIAISEIVVAASSVAIVIGHRRHYRLTKDRLEAANIASMAHVQMRAEELLLSKERDAAMKKAWVLEEPEAP